MKRWVYLAESYDLDENYSRLERHLDTRGAEGWELVAMHPGERGLVLVFKQEDENA